MPRPAIDISLVGDKELLKRLAALEKPATQKKAVRPALRKSAKRLKAEVLANLSGQVVTPRTGRLLGAMAAEKVHALKGGRTIIGAGFDLPTRAALGIDADDPYFYPFAVEYGHGGPRPAPPHPFIRWAVDRNAGRELTQIGVDIGSAITKQAMRR